MMDKMTNNIGMSEMYYLLSKASMIIDLEKEQIILNKYCLKLLGNPLYIGMYYKHDRLVIVSNGNIRTVVSYGFYKADRAVIKSKQLLSNIIKLYRIRTNGKRKRYKVCSLLQDDRFAVIEIAMIKGTQKNESKNKTV